MFVLSIGSLVVSETLQAQPGTAMNLMYIITYSRYCGRNYSDRALLTISIALMTS